MAKIGSHLLGLFVGRNQVHDPPPRPLGDTVTDEAGRSAADIDGVDDPLRARDVVGKLLGGVLRAFLDRRGSQPIRASLASVHGALRPPNAGSPLPSASCRRRAHQ